MVVFSFDDPESLRHVREWMRESARYSRCNKTVVVGNKADLPPERKVVTIEEATTLCVELGVPLVFVSAKTGLNVACFSLLSSLLPVLQHSQSSHEDTQVQLAFKVAAELALHKYCEDTGIELVPKQKKDCMLM